MTTELTPFRQQPSVQQWSTPTRPEVARRETIATRIVPLKAVYLELSVRGDSSEDDLLQAKPERHPEWYIG